MGRTPLFPELLAVAHAGGQNSEAPGLWRQLSLWLPFQAGGGVGSYDVSGWAKDGTLTSMDPPTDWVLTPYGFALDFDGSNDYVALPSVDLTGTKTLSFWMYPTAQTGIMFYAYPGAADHLIVGMHYTGDLNRILANPTGASTGAKTTPNGSTPVNAWYHVVIVKTTQSVDAIYINGKNLTTADSSYWSVGNVEVNIGRRSSATPRHFTGRLTNLAIWNGKRSLDEIMLCFSDPWAMGRVRPRVFKSSAFSGVTGNVVWTAPQYDGWAA